MMYKVSCSRTISNIVMVAGFCREGHSDRFVVLSVNGDEQESSPSFTLWALPLSEYSLYRRERTGWNVRIDEK